MIEGIDVNNRNSAVKVLRLILAAPTLTCKPIGKTMTRFPIDLDAYQRISLDAANPVLTEDQRNALKANIQLCRDAIVFFTATGAARGVGGHTGGPYDTVPEVMILDALFRGQGENMCPSSSMKPVTGWPPNT